MAKEKDVVDGGYWEGEIQPAWDIDDIRDNLPNKPKDQGGGGGNGGGNNGGGGDGQPNFRGEGLRIKLARVQGVTSKSITNDLPFYFQAPPLDSFAPSHSHAHAEYDTIEGVQYSHPQSDQLSSISFTTVNVIEKHAWVIHDRHYHHAQVTRLLREIKRKGDPIRLITWAKGQAKAELDMAVTLRDFTVTEKSGEGDARYYDLAFRQWREAETDRVGRGDNWPQKHTLKKGESLYDLAREYYGKPSNMRTIAGANEGLKNFGPRKPIDDHRKYKPGDTIKIPEPPEKDKKGGKGDKGKGNKGSKQGHGDLEIYG